MALTIAHRTPTITILSSVLVASWLSPLTAQQWTQFEMNHKDEKGSYLWTEARNWNHGVPNGKMSVEIGDDTSGKALHCVIPSGTRAMCSQFELAEHARTQGTTLRLEKGASLTVLGTAVLSKDRESWFYVDGTFSCTNKHGGIQVGGPWGRPELNEPSSGHLLISPSGVVEARYIGINAHVRAYAPPLRDRFNARSTDSEIVVQDGKLIAHQGLRMTTTDAKRPGALRLRGKATFLSDRDSPYGIDVWCGVLEIDGGDVKIRVGDIDFQGDKFQNLVASKTGKAIGSGFSVLKLTGNAVSTIEARHLTFSRKSVLDVSELNLPAGTYTVIDGESIKGDQLKLAKKTDSKKWSLSFDRENGNVMLTFEP